MIRICIIRRFRNHKKIICQLLALCRGAFLLPTSFFLFFVVCKFSLISLSIFIFIDVAGNIQSDATNIIYQQICKNDIFSRRFRSNFWFFFFFSKKIPRKHREKKIAINKTARLGTTYKNLYLLWIIRWTTILVTKKMAAEEAMDGHNLIMDHQVTQMQFWQQLTSNSASRIGAEMAFRGGQLLMGQMAEIPPPSQHHNMHNALFKVTNCHSTLEIVIYAVL